MRVLAKITLVDPPLERTLEGDNWDEVVELARGLAAVEAKKLPLIKRIAAGAFLRKASPLQFAQKIVELYNARKGEAAKSPRTCEEFGAWAVSRGLCRVIEEEAAI